jgi:hypothetical protein
MSELHRLLPVHQAADEQAAVADDARTQELRCQLLRIHLGKPLDGGKGIEVWTRMRPRIAPVEESDARSVPEPKKPPPGLQIVVRASELREFVDLGVQLIRARGGLVRAAGLSADSRFGHGPQRSTAIQTPIFPGMVGQKPR